MNKMKLIAAAAAAMAAGSAFALPPSSYVAGTTPVIYAGGGSAQQKAVAWMIDQLLTSVDTYGTACNGKSDSAYQIGFGNLKAALGGLPAGTAVLIEYKFNGGSFPNGVQPQGLGSTLPYLNNGGVAGATACAQTYPLPTFTIPATSTVAFVPDWGLADVEVKLLNASPSGLAYNTPGSFTGGTYVQAAPLTTAQAGNIQSAGIYENVFGVAVSKNVTTAACPKTTISKAEMNLVLSGIAVDWSQLQGDGGCALTPGPITLLDRAPGSGSKASGNLYFLNYPNPFFTTPGNIAFGPTGATCDGSYDDVNEGSNGALVSDLGVANASAGASCRAIGVLGGEFPPALNGNTYAFLAINGVDSGLNVATGGKILYTNEINGSYDFFYTNSFNFRNKAVGGNTQHFVGQGGFYDAAITKVKTTLQSSSIPSGASGSTALAPSGVLLDPFVTGTFTTCTTRGTHNLTSQNPLALVQDFSVALPATACQDGV